MKAHIYLILICLNFFSLNAQTGIAGNEQYNSYKQCIYIDNLAQKLTSDIFVSTYYSKLKTSDFKTSQVIDTIRQKREVHIRSKKAKDGYISVNKSIMDKVTSLGCDLDKLKISYVYNNRAVTTKEDVMRVLGLKEKRIQISEILQDEQSGVITVYIIDK
jgi:hypothetical protein